MGKRGRRGYSNQGDDQINIEQVNGNVLLKPQETVRPNAEQNLLAEVRKWVQLRLEGQLHHAVRLNLQKETQPQQVRRPWGMEVKVAIAQPSQLLSPETTIKQVFDQCGERLLILGEPGAGKTTSLLDLALELVEKAENDPQQRIPVVVDLSDWQPTVSQSNSRRSQSTFRLPGFSKKNLSESLPEKAPVWSIANWLAGKVRERYGFLPHQINQWLEEKRLIPLLDGLDEVRPEYQQDCVRAINEWLKSDLRPRQVALCCRREQYEAYTQKLELDGAVYLQDLTDEQIETFLAETNRDELKESLVADENFLALIRRPLLLSMAVLAYKELDPTQWRRATSAGDRLNLLLDAYVRRMLTQDTPSRAYRQGKIPSPEQSQKWLEILALELLQESETEFLIEQIGTTWLSTRLQKWLFTAFAVIAWGLIVAVIYWGLITAVNFWKLIIVVSFLGRFFIFRLNNLPWIGESSLFWEGFKIGSSYGLAHGIDVLKNLPQIESVVGGIQISLSNLKPQKVLRKLSSWKTILVPTEISLLINKLNKLTIPTWGFDFEEWRFKIKTLSVPNQGIKNLWRNAIPITLIFVPLHTLIVCLVLRSTFFVDDIVLISLPIALLLWIAMGVGYVCIDHFLVRLSLYCTHSIPWDYARFLNYATERLLLQRVGGRYRFVHDLLRQSLAQRRIDTHPHLISSQVFFRCAQGYHSMEQYHNALQNFDRAIELNPKYKWAIASRGITYRSMERYEEALQDFNCAIELDPQYDWAIANRGITYRSMERYEEALQDFNRAIELDPKYKWAIVIRGLTHRSMERYEEALEDFNRAIELDPKYKWAIANRGKTYRLMKRYEEALQDFNRAIELDPQYQWAIASRGKTYCLMERYEEALQDFNRAIELNPQYDWYRYLRSLIYLALQQAESAKTDLNIAIQIAQQKYTEKPDNCQNIFNLALYHLVAGNLSTAQELYQTALEQTALQTQIRDAIQDLKDFLRVFPENTSAQEIKAVLEKKLKLH